MSKRALIFFSKYSINILSGDCSFPERSEANWCIAPGGALSPGTEMVRLIFTIVVVSSCVL